jgi:hypothetical protein
MKYPLMTRLLAAAFLLGTLGVTHADAKTKSRYGVEPGRLYNTQRLRVPREQRAPGRVMRRPSIPDPEDRQPLRSSALIPSPEPSTHGGSGYQRNGKYFYATPRDIQLRRVKPGYGYNPTIPRPEPVGLGQRYRPQPSKAGVMNYNKSPNTFASGVGVYDYGSATGGVGGD